VMLHRKKTGDVIEVEIFSTPIEINNKRCQSVVAHDVTEKNLFEHKLVKAIIKTQEDERYEIGSELHDNVCQILASSQLTLGMLKTSLGASEIPLYERCRNNINLALDEIRNLSHQLAPVLFDECTLDEVFERLFDPFLMNKDCKMFMHVDEAVKECSVPAEVQLNLYRIAQEQFRNILKYAKASSIELHLFMCSNKLAMTIADNGMGFNMDKVKRGIGIANMKRRAELFGGKFEIDSAPGNGCKVTINIPLPEIHTSYRNTGETCKQAKHQSP
ncbi:MAG TPA: sensor histidine kinase, partial [Flavisolibacter sp.]|nr:sensor histidine kinase [Flavisolibacter sp.]